MKRALQNEQEQGSEAAKVSLRSLAKSVGMSPGAISEILSGKRGLSERAALQILEGLPLPAEVKNRYQEMMSTEVQGNRELLAEDAQILISHWYFMTIHCLFELEPAPRSAQEIAERLGLEEKDCQWALDCLVRYGLLRPDAEGHLEHTGIYWTTKEGVSDQVIQNAHVIEMGLAKRALTKIPVENRHISTITFTGNSRQFVRMQAEIQRFRDRISQIMEEGDCDQIYKLNVQMFPVDGWKLGSD